MTIYKSLTKKEIAIDAGVSIDTVKSWCKQMEEKMLPYGYIHNARILNPICVSILAEHFCFTPHNAVIR